MTDITGPDRAEADQDRLDQLARMFAHAPEFTSSPLYTSLAATVAATPALLRLAARARPGLVAADPPDVRRGDAVDLCPALARELPPGEPRVVFHAATRLHVAHERRPTFDAAIDSLGENAPLYRIHLESGVEPALAVAEGRLEWIEPLLR